MERRRHGEQFKSGCGEEEEEESACPSTVIPPGFTPSAAHYSRYSSCERFPLVSIPSSAGGAMEPAARTPRAPRTGSELKLVST